jgi:membrane protease YdiL (CAAX protease family)
MVKSLLHIYSSDNRIKRCLLFLRHLKKTTLPVGWRTWSRNWLIVSLFWFAAVMADLTVAKVRSIQCGHRKPDGYSEALWCYTPTLNDLVIFLFIWAVFLHFRKAAWRTLRWRWPPLVETIRLRGKPFRVPLASVAGSLLLGVLLLLCARLLLWWQPPPALTPLDKLLAGSYETRVMFGLSAVITAPFVEEVLYRGLLFRAVARSWGKWVAVVASVVPFIFIHMNQYEGSPGTLAAIGVLGAVCAIVRARTGRLSLAWLTHVGFNAAMAVISIMR